MAPVTLPRGDVLWRAALPACAAWLASLTALVILVALLLGDADADWQSGRAQAGVWVMLNAAAALAVALGTGVGTWRAAVAGAQTRGEAVLAGGLAPAGLAALLTVVLLDPSGRGLLAALGALLAIAVGAAAGGLVVARRLDG